MNQLSGPTPHGTNYGTSVYRIKRVLSDYLVNGIGEVGSYHHPVNSSGVNQILLSQWKYMVGVRNLYSVVAKAIKYKSKISKMAALQSINNYNKKNNTDHTYDEIRMLQLERPDGNIFSPVADPWIFFKCKQGYSIYDLLNLNIPSISAEISEAERLFIHLIEFMEILYIAHWENETLHVIKSKWADHRPVDDDDRLPEHTREMFNLWGGIHTFIDRDTLQEDYHTLPITDTYTLSPELEQTLLMENESPELCI